MFLNPYRFAITGATASFSMWDPTKKSAAVTLSAGDSVMTPSPSGYAKAVAGKSTGIFYFEAKVTRRNSTDCHWGIANITSTYDSGNSTLYGGYYVVVRGDGYIAMAGGTGGSAVSYVLNDVMGVSIDFSIMQLKIYKNGAVIHTRTIPADTYYPYANGFNNNHQFTISASPVYLPTGFAPWL